MEGKMINKKLLVQMNRDIFFVEFYVNTSESEWEHSVIFGRTFLEQTKGVVDFANGLLTIQPGTDVVDFEKLNVYASEMNERTKVFSLHRIADDEEVGQKYITPCYVEGVFASDGILDLDIEKNLISQELMDQLGLAC